MTRKNGLFYIRIGNEIGQKAFDTVFLVKGNHPGETMYFVGHKINEGNNKYAISVHRSGLRFRAYWTKTEALKYFDDDIKKYSYAQLRAADSLEKYQTINAYAPGVTQAWTVAKNPKRKRRVLKNPETPAKKIVSFVSGRVKAIGYDPGRKTYFFVSTNGLTNAFSGRDSRHTFIDRLKSAVDAWDAPKVNKLVQSLN